MILKIKNYINMINNIILILKLFLFINKIININIINSIHLNYLIKYYII